MVSSKSTGIIFNNGMNDFSDKKNLYGVPPSSWNKIAPNKTPASSCTPTILTDQNGEVVMVIGASGGPRIPMAILEVGEQLCVKYDAKKQKFKKMKFHNDLGFAVTANTCVREQKDKKIIGETTITTLLAKKH